MDLSLLLPVFSLIFTVVSKLLLMYSNIDKKSGLKMKSFSTVRDSQRGSQSYMGKRRGRREIEVKEEEKFSSIKFSHSVVSDSLRPHESQHAWPPCPSPTENILLYIHKNTFIKSKRL